MKDTPISKVAKGIGAVESGVGGAISGLSQRVTKAPTWTARAGTLVSGGKVVGAPGSVWDAATLSFRDMADAARAATDAITSLNGISAADLAKYQADSVGNAMAEFLKTDGTLQRQIAIRIDNLIKLAGHLAA